MHTFLRHSVCIITVYNVVCYNIKTLTVFVLLFYCIVVVYVTWPCVNCNLTICVVSVTVPYDNLIIYTVGVHCWVSARREI